MKMNDPVLKDLFENGPNAPKPTGPGTDGRVTDRRAQAVLCRAFERMLRAGGEAQVLRLSDAEAEAFPRGCRLPAPGASAWLAAGVDRAWLATYALRWLDVTGLDPIAQRRAAEAVLLSVLALECASYGFPVAGHA